MKLTIIIPVYISNELHLDFTRQTLESIKTKHEYDVYVVNNYCHPQYISSLQKLVTGSWSLVPNPKGNILASAWNLGLDLAFPTQATRNQKPETRNSNELVTGSWSLIADYCLIINNDIIFHPQCIDNLVAFAQTKSDFLLWSASEWPNLAPYIKPPLLHPGLPTPTLAASWSIKKQSIK
jgi:hypothetical protein